MLAVVDYGMGNLHSVTKALERVGGRPVLTGDPGEVRRADRLVLPGVGAFGDAIGELRRTGLDEAILEHLRAERPFLGICLGLQLLVTTGCEGGQHAGLNVIPGDCVRFDSGQDTGGECTRYPDVKVPGTFSPDGRPLRVPHMGWNQVWPTREVPVLAGIPAGTWFYFVHSYYVRPAAPEDVAAETDYGVRFCSMIQRGSLFATQFHPEKSQSWGLKLLENWLAL